ncbi:DsbA family oxidoreductase [Nocardioides sp.]|uniref:DsbA family oxidoreductase n=1 Tax=Nocardioides sp. TaxID=35761 RepID=UPI002ED3CCB6
MKIDIWSDVVCPWCYIGKRRLEQALAGFEHADDVEIIWHSFELDPTAPAVSTESVAEHLGRKYGGGEAAGRQMVSRVTAVAGEEGLSFERYPDARHANTRDAHRLVHLALEVGGPVLQGRLEEALFAANFTRADDVADHDVLARIAVAVGLPEQRVRQVLASREFADAVDADIAQAAAYGAGGVPFFVIDQRYGVSGAQPVEVFGQVLERAWTEAHPAVEVVAGGEVCGPDGGPDGGPV